MIDAGVLTSNPSGVGFINNPNLEEDLFSPPLLGSSSERTGEVTTLSQASIDPSEIITGISPESFPALEATNPPLAITGNTDQMTGELSKDATPDTSFPGIEDEYFDLEYYAKANPGLADAGITTPEQLSQHFKDFGLSEGRSFSCFFDVNFYWYSNPDLQAAGLTPQQLYDHWKNQGIAEGRKGSAFVNIKYYLEQNADVKEAFGNDFKAAFQHLQKHGIAEGRKFSPWVDLKYYLEQNADVKEAFGKNYKQALEHLEKYGLAEGRKFSPEFNLEVYLEKNQDVAKHFQHNNLLIFDHWQNFGVKEGRQCLPKETSNSTWEVSTNEDDWLKELPAINLPSLSRLDNTSVNEPVTSTQQSKDGLTGNSLDESEDIQTPIPASDYELDKTTNLPASNDELEETTNLPVSKDNSEDDITNLPATDDELEETTNLSASDDLSKEIINLPISEDNSEETTNLPASDNSENNPIFPTTSDSSNNGVVETEPVDSSTINEGNAPIPEEPASEQLNPIIIPSQTLMGVEAEPTPPKDLPENAGGKNSKKNPAPKHFQIGTTKAEFLKGETIHLKDVWAFDASGAGDLKRIEFSLHDKTGKECLKLENATNFMISSKDDRWGWLNYQISGLAPGEYQLKGVAYDQAGGKSNTAVACFTVSQQALITPLLGFIDTGYAANNPDIDYSRITLGKDWIDGDDNPLLEAGEGNEHGTHILGLVAAIQNNGVGVYGMNDQAKIWLGRAVGSGKWAESLMEFVDYAKASGQSNAVVNLSLDLTQIEADGTLKTRYELTPREREALEYARQNGVLIVVAAGNDGGVMSVLGQASQEFDNLITVGAANGNQRANYSSFGQRGPDIMAEGGSLTNLITSTSGDDVGAMAGTSVATAQVTGAASLLWEANAELNYRQIIEALKSTATDLNVAGVDKETGAGLLNTEKAVEAAKSMVPVDYMPVALLTPETWSGDGKVTPSERAAADEFMGKWYDWEPYTIQSGDTLSQIALDRMGSASADYYNFIAQHNGIADPDIINAGDIIEIPYVVTAPISDPTPTSGDEEIPAEEPTNEDTSISAPQPGEGNVPLNAGEFVEQSTSNGVNTYYYTNGYLMEQPNGQQFWYSLGAGVPVGGLTITATPVTVGNINAGMTGNFSFADFNGDGKTDFIRQEKGSWANDDNIRTAEIYFSKGNGQFDITPLPNFRDLNGNFTNLITNERPILLKEGDLATGSGPEVYLVEGNQRRWIPNPETFNAMRLDWNAIQYISDGDLNDIPLGQPLPAIEIPTQPSLHSNPSTSNPLRGFQHPLGWSTATRINWTHSTSFGQAYAVDFGAGFGTSVYAMRSGTVVGWRDTTPDRNTNLASINDGQNGTTANFLVVKLDDNDGYDDGYRAMYLHLKQGSIPQALKRSGARVNAGDYIGQIGYNGVSYGVHLHAEVNKLTGTQQNMWNRQTVPFQWN